MGRKAFDLLYDLQTFYRNHNNKRIGVFFHTSLILDSVEHLNQLFAQKTSGVSIYLPENSVYELKLLAKYSSFPKYREKAQIILNSCLKKNNWTYTNIIKWKASLLAKFDIDIALFVFFEPAAASLFSSRMGLVPNVFLMSYNPYDTTRVFNSAELMGRPVIRPCKTLGIGKLNESYKKSDRFTVYDKNHKVVKEFYQSELKSCNCGGGEAKLFVHSSMPGKIIKIFGFSLGEGMTEKLKVLLSLYHSYPKCVLPYQLVYRGDKCIGYVMDRIDGKNLDCVGLAYYSFDDKINLIRNLSVILLELRIAQIGVTDLSSGNIFILNDGTIRLIDCDSMEFYIFPGGGITPPYGHPDVTEDYFYKKLRTADQLSFSFAVMIFEIMLGWKNPLLQKGLGDIDPVWKKQIFPFDNQNGVGVAASGAKVNDARLKDWCNCPLSVRQGFVDVFTFQSAYDIGEWVKRIKLI